MVSNYKGFLGFFFILMKKTIIKFGFQTLSSKKNNQIG